MNQDKITIKLSEILKILNKKVDPELINPEDISYIGVSGHSKSNAVIFRSNFKELDYVLGRVSNSLILTETNDDCFLKANNGNIVVHTTNFIKDYISLYRGLKLSRIIEDFQLDPYNTVVKKCLILSKTAKIYNAQIGKGCSIHHNVLIGVDNLIPVRLEDGLRSIPTLGLVKIGDHVDIFNNSIIYRGVLDVTSIGDNVKIGSNTVIESDVNIGNNVYIGNNCVIKRAVCIPDNVSIESGSVIDLDTDFD